MARQVDNSRVPGHWSAPEGCVEVGDDGQAVPGACQCRTFEEHRDRQYEALEQIPADRLFRATPGNIDSAYYYIVSEDPLALAYMPIVDAPRSPDAYIKGVTVEDIEESRREHQIVGKLVTDAVAEQQAKRDAAPEGHSNTRQNPLLALKSLSFRVRKSYRDEWEGTLSGGDALAQIMRQGVYSGGPYRLTQEPVRSGSPQFELDFHRRNGLAMLLGADDAVALSTLQDACSMLRDYYAVSSVVDSCDPFAPAARQQALENNKAGTWRFVKEELRTLADRGLSKSKVWPELDTADGYSALRVATERRRHMGEEGRAMYRAAGAAFDWVAASNMIQSLASEACSLLADAEIPGRKSEEAFCRIAAELASWERSSNPKGTVADCEEVLAVADMLVRNREVDRLASLGATHIVLLSGEQISDLMREGNARPDAPDRFACFSRDRDDGAEGTLRETFRFNDAYGDWHLMRQGELNRTHRADRLKEQAEQFEGVVEYVASDPDLAPGVSAEAASGTQLEP